MSKETLTHSQESALKTILRGENVFITGEAGAGKSFLIKEFMKQKSKKEYPLLSSTGISAVLIGGRTFHSFFGLGIMEGGVHKTVERALKDKRVIKRLQKASGIIIDEVSMLNGETLEAAEIITRKARDFELLPWGGLQVIAVGDFLQLPPVNTSKSKKSWAFNHPIWEYSRFHNLILKENKRTENKVFLKILNELRKGNCNSSVNSFLNEKQNFDSTEFIEATYLYPRKRQTDEHNRIKLQDIDSPLIIYKSIYFGQERFVERLKKYTPIPEEIHLKLGAYIMLRKNDPKNRWVNGSTGILKDIHEEYLLIELTNGRLVEVEKTTFSLLDAEGKEIASVMNYPLSLAYATTIHKAQGMTIDRLVVNLKNLWEPGQAYVALSRVRNPDNLFVQDWSPSSIKVDPTVIHFYDSIQR